jgi:hypothetical protein
MEKRARHVINIKKRLKTLKKICHLVRLLLEAIRPLPILQYM